MADEEKDTRASEPEVQASLRSLNLEAPEMVKIRPASIMGMTKAEQDSKTIRFVKNGKRREKHKQKGKVPRRNRGPRRTFDGILDWAPSGSVTKKGKRSKHGTGFPDASTTLAVGAASGLILFFLFSK